MDGSLQELGVGAVVTILLFREMVAFVKYILNRKNDEKEVNDKEKKIIDRLGLIEAKIDMIKGEVRDLHIWHDVSDADGVKTWYVRRSLEDAIGKLSENIGLENQLFQRMIDRFEDLTNDVKELKRR